MSEKKTDWQQYHRNQLNLLPIFSQKYFYSCVEHTLKDLHDNHSFLIKIHNSINTQPNTSQDAFSVKLEEGVGIINVPTLITDIHQSEDILNEPWVIELYNKIECVAPKVTDGWIIDLTQNAAARFMPFSWT